MVQGAVRVGMRYVLTEVGQGATLARLRNQSPGEICIGMSEVAHVMEEGCRGADRIKGIGLGLQGGAAATCDLCSAGDQPSGPAQRGRG